MSSVQAAYADTVKLPTKFSALITPSYVDTSSGGGQVDLPIPFTVVNQVLDINVGQSAAIQTFVSAGTEPERYANIQGKAFGGVRLITSFGPDMTLYLRNWIQNVEVLGARYAGPLVLYIQPVMTKVQLANPVFAIDGAGVFQRDWSFGFTTEAPVSSEYTGGGITNNFFTAWIFKTPMTVQYVTAAGAFKYLTLTSQFAEQ